MLASEYDFLLQKPENLVVYDAVPILPNYCHGESSNNVESGNYSDSGNYIQPGNNVVDSGGYFEQPIETFEEDRKPIIREGSIQPCSLFPEEQIGCGVQDENVVNLESSNNNVFVADTCYSDIPIDHNYLPDEPFMDPNNNLPLNDGLYLETNDLSCAQQDDFNFEDYLSFFDDEGLTFDDSLLMGPEDFLPDQEALDQKVRPVLPTCLVYIYVKNFCLTHLYINSLPLKNWRRRSQEAKRQWRKRKVAKDLLQNKIQISRTLIQVTLRCSWNSF